MTARAVGRELAKSAQGGNTDVTQWAGRGGVSPSKTKVTASTTTLPKAYDVLQSRTRLALMKALQYQEPVSHASQTPLTSPRATTSTIFTPRFRSFESLAREAFFKASAVSKVPLWAVDPDKVEDMRDYSSNKDNVPVTVPGYGRKLWAGQEDLSLSVTEKQKLVRQRLEEQEEQDDDDDDDDVEEPQRDIPSHLDAENARTARLQSLKKKLRHADGRNGLNTQRSALRRANGIQAAPRTHKERRFKESMPAM